MADEILNDDYKVSPCGPLGGKTGVSQNGKFLGDFTETNDALTFIKERMEKDQFFPNIWWVSDHGNAWLIDTDGNEIHVDDDAFDDDDDDDDDEQRIDEKRGLYPQHVDDCN